MDAPHLREDIDSPGPKGTLGFVQKCQGKEVLRNTSLLFSDKYCLLLFE